ncbi:ABC transporter permease [Methanospirillum lacunae]|uniref:ABC transporter permease n=1 Tax=Methanospirillum lacunae TaxID=668570 RepID=A0A2V2N7Q9_9EURY|nr:ABC transporter permease [Methanospirillum lacunae]PWR71313.1 ABC transporter permease [Methanospirillum lacunae]
MNIASFFSLFLRRKFLRYLCSFIVVLLIVFLIPRLMPGDPVINLVGEDVILTQSVIAELHANYGLDKPLYEQFLTYCSHLSRLDLGYSYHMHAQVLDLLISRVGWTLLYVGIAVILGSILGIIIGAFSGWRSETLLAKFFSGLALMISSTPPYLLGLFFLVIFVYHLGWFPFKGLYDTFTITSIAHHIALPVIVLTLFYASRNLLIMRGTTITEKNLLYPQFAKALGITDSEILRRHVRRNAVIPLITLFALDFGFLISGALFIEIVFSLNGMGSLIYDAIQLRDYPILTSSFLIISLLVIIANIIADIIILMVDPRARED